MLSDVSGRHVMPYIL